MYLDKKSLFKFWKSYGSGLSIHTPDPDWICLGRGLCSPIALVVHVIDMLCAW